MSTLREDPFWADVFRADLEALAERARPVDLHDRVLLASRRAQMRSAVAAVAVITVLAAAVGMAVWLRPTGPVLPAGPLTPVMLPQGHIPVMESMGGEVVRDQRAFSDGTLTVPTWPDLPECLSGPLEFSFGGRAVDDPNSVTMEVGIIKSIRADVDGDGSDELLVHMGCYRAPDIFVDQAIMAQVVAYSGERVLGRVVASPLTPDPVSGIPGYIGVHITDVSVDAEGRVRVDWVDLSVWPLVTSSRTFAWDGDGFREIGEATDLRGPTGVELVVEARGVRGVDQLGQDYVTVDVSVRNAGPARSSALRLAMVVPVNLQPAGPGWDGCVLPSGMPYLNLTPSPGEFKGAFAVTCPAAAIDPGQALTHQFHLLVGDGPNAAVLSASPSPSASWPPDPSFLAGPRAPSDAPVLSTISVEVDQQPPGGHERDRTDNTVQFPMP